MNSSIQILVSVRHVIVLEMQNGKHYRVDSLCSLTSSLTPSIPPFESPQPHSVNLFMISLAMKEIYKYKNKANKKHLNIMAANILFSFRG